MLQLVVHVWREGHFSTNWAQKACKSSSIVMVNNLLGSHLNSQRVVLEWLVSLSARCTVQVALILSVSLFIKGNVFAELASPVLPLTVILFSSPMLICGFTLCL